MPDVEAGSEQLTDEDRVYSGSRFRDVVDALFDNPYQKVWGREGEPPLPDKDTTLRPLRRTVTRVGPEEIGAGSASNPE